MADEEEPKALKDQRIPILMTESEVGAIDDWMFANRIKSRGEAIRRLCRIALFIGDKLDDILEEFAAGNKDLLQLLDQTEEPPPADSWEYKLLDILTRPDGAGLIRVMGDVEELAMVTRPLKQPGSFQKALEEAARTRVLMSGRHDPPEADEPATPSARTKRPTRKLKITGNKP